MSSERLFIVLSVEHDGDVSEGCAMDYAMLVAEHLLHRQRTLHVPRPGGRVGEVTVEIDEMFPESKLVEYLKEKPCRATSSVA